MYRCRSDPQIVAARAGFVTLVPQAHFGPIKVPHQHPDERFLFLSDVLTTAWRLVAGGALRQAGPQRHRVRDGAPIAEGVEMLKTVRPRPVRAGAVAHWCSTSRGRGRRLRPRRPPPREGGLSGFEDAWAALIRVSPTRSTGPVRSRSPSPLVLVADSDDAGDRPPVHDAPGAVRPPALLKSVSPVVGQVVAGVFGGRRVGCRNRMAARPPARRRFPCAAARQHPR